VRDELLRVLLLLDAAEVLEQTLDQRPAVLHEAGAQGLEPGVQRPGNAWEQHGGHSEYTPRGGGGDRADHASISGGGGRYEDGTRTRLKNVDGGNAVCERSVDDVMMMEAWPSGSF